MKPIDNIHSDIGREKGRIATNGAASFVRPTSMQLPGVFTAVWTAEPGVYHHPGQPTGEIFLVVEGTASITLGDLGSHEVGPGTIVTMPMHVPCSLTIHSSFRKFALVPQGEPLAPSRVGGETGAVS